MVGVLDRSAAVTSTANLQHMAIFQAIAFDKLEHVKADGRLAQSLQQKESEGKERVDESKRKLESKDARLARKVQEKEVERLKLEAKLRADEQEAIDRATAASLQEREAERLRRAQQERDTADRQLAERLQVSEYVFCLLKCGEYIFVLLVLFAERRN